MIQQSELQDTLDRVQELTRAADQKVSITVLIATAFAALYLPHIPDWFTNESLASYRVLIALATVLWLASITAAGAALFARTKTKHGPSVTFFGSIAGWTIQDYTSQLAAMTPQALAEDFIGQIHSCAEICDRKHFWANISLLTFFISVFTIVLTYIVRAWNA